MKPSILQNHTFFTTSTLGGGERYWFGFQGQEAEDELYGEGNASFYKYRISDNRLGRFFSVDPLAAQYPYNSPYAFSENRVIDRVELEGLEATVPPGQIAAMTPTKHSLLTHIEVSNEVFRLATTSPFLWKKKRVYFEFGQASGVGGAVAGGIRGEGKGRAEDRYGITIFYHSSIRGIEPSNNNVSGEYYIGASVGVQMGFAIDYNAETFYEAINNPLSTTVDFGIASISLRSDFKYFSLAFGPSAGGGWGQIPIDVTSGISMSYKEFDMINNIRRENLDFRHSTITTIYNESDNTYNLGLLNLKGEVYNTGIQMDLIDKERDYYQTKGYSNEISKTSSNTSN